MTANNTEKKIVSDKVMKRYAILIRPYLKDIRKLKARGVPECLIAEKYGISYTTWNRWKSSIKELYTICETAKAIHTEKLEAKATRIAEGYFVDEVTETYGKDGVLIKTEKKHKFIRPDGIMVMFLLKHLRPEMYADINVGMQQDVNITFVPTAKKAKGKDKKVNENND